MNKFLSILILLLSSNYVKAQEVFDEKKITEHNTSYFKLERENIHAQFNKTIFSTGEMVWVKGYVINKINNLPSVNSSNIIMEIYNSAGIKVDSKLLYAENSTFHGYYNTEKISESGKYTFRFFTNYMNNFVEDESSSYELTIINPSNYKNNLLPEFSFNNSTINYYPESGVFLESTDNNIIVEIKDCNGLSKTIQNIEVLNEKNEVLTNFSTNENGIGKFSLLKPSGANYKIRVQNQQGKIIEKTINKPAKTGYIISINDVLNSETLYVDIKTNELTLSRKETLWLGVQYLNDLSFVKIEFDNNTSKKLSFSKKELNFGVNNFILLNNKKEILAERLFYNHCNEVNNKIEVINKTVIKDSIKYRFKSNFNLGEISLSVLPPKTLTNPNKYTIYSSLTINNFISKNIENSSYYFNDFNRLRNFELDNALQCVRYKYNLTNNINIPSEKFNYENGLTLSGKINSITNNRTKDLKINLICVASGVNLTTDIDEKNEFKFEKIIVSDSTSIHLTLVNKKNEVMQFTPVFNLIKPKNTFFKPILGSTNCFETISENSKTNSFKFPIFDKNTKFLDSIVISETNKKPKLKNNKSSNYVNSMIDGYKVTDELAKSYSDLISFLRAKGYDIATQGGQVSIVSRVSRSFNQTREPAIMVDNVPIMDVNYLNSLRMEEIDEIYINKRGYGAGGAGRNGVISIFTKKTFSGKKQSNITAKSYLCKDGFLSFLPYKKDRLYNPNDEASVNFDNIFWNSRVNTDQNGFFEVAIPIIKNEEFLIVLDGINSTGQLINKTINVQP